MFGARFSRGLLCAAVLAAESVRAADAPMAAFSAMPLGAVQAPWEALRFKNKAETRYRIVSDPALGTKVLKAESNSQASALLWRLHGPVSDTPKLHFSWKIGNALNGSDPTQKSGDDYPARVYIAFRYDPARASFWQRAQAELVKSLYGEYVPHATLTYVFLPGHPVESIIDNPYTSRVKMIVVDNALSSIGEWKSFDRNVLADYTRAFGDMPTALEGIALMTDTDNTGGKAETWYGDLRLSP